MSDWQPIHHEDYADQPLLPGSDPAEPGADRPERPRRPRSESRSDDSAGKQQAPVSLMLDLPRDFISAMWGCFEQLTRVATALEENNKLLTQNLEKNRPNPRK